MACFAVPAAEAIVTAVAAKIVKAKETDRGEASAFSLSGNLNRLSVMLGGGSALLMFEHLWHGEIIPALPVFTASRAAVLDEMSTVGTAMSLVITAVWLGITLVTGNIAKKAERPSENE